MQKLTKIKHKALYEEKYFCIQLYIPQFTNIFQKKMCKQNTYSWLRRRS